VCDARDVEPAVVVSVVLAVATLLATIVAVRRGQALDRALATTRRLRDEHAASDQAAAERAADDARLHEVLDSGLLRLDESMRIREANPRAHVMLGHQPGALVGRTIMEAFLDPGVEALALDAVQTGAATGEIRPAGPDGPVLVIRARPGSPDAVWLVLDDVSELRRLQRIRTEFIDNLSHELRTPITTVSLLAETLQREAQGASDAIPTRMRERIAKIEVETGHLVQMVNELLDLSRIESGGTLQLVDGVDMGRLAADSADRLRLFAERQGVTLRIDTPTGLPRVRGDAARLGQVVVNLVHNAVKFSLEGGEITVRTFAHDGTVVTSVEDHGIGIPRATRDRVFERFYKVDRARLRADAGGGGTGLGLAIARHVIEQHDGRIWVESEEGVGSTFYFALPISGGSDTPATR
jgi:two-component system, OmpR family, phosphate regulon sensor histidine kinase PhoR